MFYFLVGAALILLVTSPAQESQAKTVTTSPAFYGGDFGYYGNLLYGDNILQGNFFKDRIDGVVTLSDEGVFTYEQVDILKINGGITLKHASPNFRVYLLFTDVNDPTKRKSFILGWSTFQDNLHSPISATLPLYQIGYNYTFQVIIHEELTTNAIGAQIQLLFEGVDL